MSDMLRVPGSRGDMLQLRSQGSDVRVVYSPLDAVNLVAARPDRQVVFFAIGFETTAPPNALAVWLARQRRLTNFSVLVSHVLVPPAITLIPKSGYRLRSEYWDYDAERRFDVDDLETEESSVCISGEVLKGMKKPHDCPAFGTQCTPQTPLGATMVSAEGACAAYYAYGRRLGASPVPAAPPLVQVGEPASGAPFRHRGGR